MFDFCNAVSDIDSFIAKLVLERRERESDLASYEKIVADAKLELLAYVDDIDDTLVMAMKHMLQGNIDLIESCRHHINSIDNIIKGNEFKKKFMLDMEEESRKC